MSSKDTDEEGLIHSKSDNIEIMVNDKEYEVIEVTFNKHNDNCFQYAVTLAFNYSSEKDDWKKSPNNEKIQ